MKTNNSLMKRVINGFNKNILPYKFSNIIFSEIDSDNKDQDNKKNRFKMTFVSNHRNMFQC